nr:MAG TPA: hypothetical protein [Caudoviricetes sp.]
MTGHEQYVLSRNYQRLYRQACLAKLDMEDPDPAMLQSISLRKLNDIVQIAKGYRIACKDFLTPSNGPTTAEDWVRAWEEGVEREVKAELNSFQ